MVNNKINSLSSEKNNLTNDKWRAIIQNDSSYDDQFFYAVKTTRIFCRPSCKSRVPNKVNVCIFQTADQALAENFRPCKRCKPSGLRLPDEEWVKQIKGCIEERFQEHLTLEVIAEMCHGSAFHLQRTFKRITNMTPHEYIQRVRIYKAKQYLYETEKSIMEIGLDVGITNTSHFATLFKKKTGYTPSQYREKYKRRE
jgi:AraC family transcriptional regulator of adaptative response / methylphosphotriester-DNA alkyltransferase methyltransferase